MRTEKITSIRKREPATVYNISVLKDESYIANGIIVHNCRSAMLPVPLSMPVDESLLFKNRDFSDAVDQNHRHVPTDFEPDISKALGEIDKFKQKYAINKFILDADIERRLLKLGVGMGTPVIDQGFFGVPEKPRFKRGFEVRAEIPKIRDELENQITEATREIEELNQARYALRGKYDKLDNEWRVRLANYDLDFDTPEYKSYMERLEKIKIELDGAENLFADALRKRTKLYQDSGNVIKNAIRINDGERRTIYNFNDFKDRAEYEKLMKSLGINQENSPFDGMEKAEEFINSVASSEVRDRLGNIKMVAEDGRAYTRNDGSKKIYIDGYYRPNVIIHESGHQIEFSDPRIKTAANDFLGRRTAGEEARPLSELTGDPRYGSSEIAKKDKFMSPYVGKIYDDKDTEVISMGIQYLYEDPEKLMKEDPELFDLVIDVLRGNLDAGDSD